MHVCVAVMMGWPMGHLSRRRPAKVAWSLYPAWIAFVVVATGNHYFTDVILGALAAVMSAVIANRFFVARPMSSREALKVPHSHEKRS